MGRVQEPRMTYYVMTPSGILTSKGRTVVSDSEAEVRDLIRMQPTWEVTADDVDVVGGAMPFVTVAELWAEARTKVTNPPRWAG